MMPSALLFLFKVDLPFFTRFTIRFHVLKSPVGVSIESVTHFLNLIIMDNNKRMKTGKI